MRISSSDINTFLECRLKWNYSSDNRMHLESKSVRSPLFLGTAVHDALEAFYTGETTDMARFIIKWGKAQLRTFEEQDIYYDPEVVARDLDLASDMMLGYLREYGDDPNNDRDGIHVIECEQEFALPIPGTRDGWFVGRLDGLCTDSQGLLWIFETKTYQSAPTLHKHTLQQTAYVWAANRLVKGGAFKKVGIEPTRRVYGTLYNGLRKQKPGPRVTAPLFRREWHDRSLEELRIFERTLASLYREMANIDVAIYPSYGLTCSWCDFKDPCSCWRLGEDEEAELRLNYQRAKSRGSVYQDGVSE